MKIFPKAIGWDNWGGLMCDVELFSPLVREACAAFGYAPRSISAGFPGTHAVFLVDDVYVVKLYAPLGIPDEAAERACYRAIDAFRVPLTPKLYAEGVLRAGGYEWPYIVIEYMPGRAVRDIWPELSAERRTKIGAELGRWAVGYHALKNPFDKNLSVASWDAEKQLDKSMKTLIVDQRMDRSLIDELRAFALSRIAEKERPVMLLHCDLTEDHLLIEGDEMRVIDFADSRMAWECLEWVTLWFGLLARDDRAFFAFLEACGRRWSEAVREELLLGALLHSFGAQILLGTLGDEVEKVRVVEDLMKWMPAV